MPIHKQAKGKIDMLLSAAIISAVFSKTSRVRRFAAFSSSQLILLQIMPHARNPGMPLDLGKH